MQGQRRKSRILQSNGSRVVPDCSPSTMHGTIVSFGKGHYLASLVIKIAYRKEGFRFFSRRQRRASSLCISGAAWRAGMLACPSCAAAPPPVPPSHRRNAERWNARRAATGAVSPPPALDPGTARPRLTPWRADPPFRGRGLPIVDVSLLPRCRRFSNTASVVP